jgi:hypothetical protein
VSNGDGIERAVESDDFLGEATPEAAGHHDFTKVVGHTGGLPIFLGCRREVSRRLPNLQENQLFVKRSKCEFGRADIAYLSHMISTAGIAMDRQKVHAILDWPLPRMVWTVRALLGLVGYYRRFINGYGTSRPTHRPALQGRIPLECRCRGSVPRPPVCAHDSAHAPIAHLR